jgi:aminoacrylate hydrolase
MASGTGPALLLVSGLGGTGGFWASAAARLDTAFRVIRFDQRGIAGSTRGTAACSIDQLARDCLSVLDAAGVGRAFVLGHSTGGCIGQALAHIAPERLGALVLSASWHQPAPWFTAAFEMRRRVLDADPIAYAASAVQLAYPPDWLNDNWAVYEAALAKAPVAEAARNVVRERIDALLSFRGGTPVLPEGMPAFILGAQDDMIVPPFLQDSLAAALPDAPRENLASGGHFYPASRTEAFAGHVMRWLSSLPKHPS